MITLLFGRYFVNNALQSLEYLSAYCIKINFVGKNKLMHFHESIKYTYVYIEHNKKDYNVRVLFVI